MKRMISAVLLFFAAALCAVEVGNFGVLGLPASGVSGARLKKVISFRPDVVIVMVGFDDFVNLRHLTETDAYIAQMERIVKEIRKSNAVPVLVNIHPTREIARRELAKYKNIAPNARISAANAELQKLAERENVLLIDLNTAVASAKNAPPAEYRSCGFFTVADSEFLANMIFTALKDAKISLKRIACIGGADTYGYQLKGAGTAEGESWPAELKRLFNQAADSSGK